MDNSCFCGGMIVWNGKFNKIKNIQGKNFISQVLDIANRVSHWLLTFQSSNYCYQMRKNAGDNLKSSMRPKENDDLEASDIVTQSESCYKKEAREAVNDLLKFLTDLHVDSSPPICVTYFDEAHMLDKQFLVLLRLVSHQPPTKEMWYVFMGTKSSISYFSPPPRNCESPIFFALCSSLIRRTIVHSLRLPSELMLRSE